MYCTTNYTTKKALKAAVDNGKRVSVMSSRSRCLGLGVRNGTYWLEGPHYPRPHTWYAQATLVDGYVTKVK